jgi:hypothetical protein
MMKYKISEITGSKPPSEENKEKRGRPKEKRGT